MHFTKSLLVACTALTLSLAAPSPLEKRATIRINAYNTGDCGGLNTSYDGASAGCHNFNGVSYGAQYEVLSGATCTFKSWEYPDCHGKATVRTISGQNPQCYPIANKGDGTFYITDGVQSVSITCS